MIFLLSRLNLTPETCGKGQGLASGFSHFLSRFDLQSSTRLHACGCALPWAHWAYAATPMAAVFSQGLPAAPRAADKAFPAAGPAGRRRRRHFTQRSTLMNSAVQLNMKPCFFCRAATTKIDSYGGVCFRIFFSLGFLAFRLLGFSASRLLALGLLGFLLLVYEAFGGFLALALAFRIRCIPSWFLAVASRILSITSSSPASVLYIYFYVCLHVCMSAIMYSLLRTS